jgi:hypothetical protein
MSEAAKQDGRKARSWWHEEARLMKGGGASISEIAKKFDRSEFAVSMATKGVKSKNLFGRGRRSRGNLGVTSGFRMGSLLRVAVNFTDEQILEINSIALKTGSSFSLTVSKLVDVAIQEHRKANDA